MSNNIVLPALISLAQYGGDYGSFIDEVYKIFEKDFVFSKPTFRGKRLGLKRHPEYQGRAYTFYHMTHSGKKEDERTPDLRRCERIGWAKPSINNCDNWTLKIWPQVRNGHNRICIWLERPDEPDYMVILDDRQEYILPWTAFVIERPHEKRKKEKEYLESIRMQKPPN